MNSAPPPTPAQQRDVHALLVEPIAAAVLLGAIEGDVGVAQDLLGRRLLAPAHDHDAGRGRHDHAPAVQLDRLGERGQQVARHLARRVGRGAALEQDGELVAAEPRGGVAGREPLGQPPRADPQQLVAGGVAERVVDLAEVVEVDEHDGEPLLLRAARVDGVLEPVHEQRPVGEPGQPVVERAARELLLQRDAVGDVARVDDDAAHGGSPSRLATRLSTAR
jgi:hypothetical protein